MKSMNLKIYEFEYSHLYVNLNMYKGLVLNIMTTVSTQNEYHVLATGTQTMIPHPPSLSVSLCLCLSVSLSVSPEMRTSTIMRNENKHNNPMHTGSPLNTWSPYHFGSSPPVDLIHAESQWNLQTASFVLPF